jgi:formylglycine-generating enzyme required for sulfatase activity
MGSTDADDQADSDEKPQHTVYLDAFWIDRTEVTNAQFRQCVEAGACQAPATCDWGEPSYGGQGQADRPVVCVNWNQAQAYCQWAGARLPTEAEWEKAARGTDGQRFPWGDDLELDGTRLNFCDRNCENTGNDAGVNDGYARTAPVGTYPAGASPYGALDMAGNVWEWVADSYGGDYYAGSPQRNPQGPGSGSDKVLRGGAWDRNWSNVRAANRNPYDPKFRGYNVGFRCVALSPGG